MNPNADEDWQACPNGMLSDCSSRQRRLAHRRSLAKLGGGAVALVGGCLLIVAFSVWAQDGEQDPVGATEMSCGDVLKRIDGYLAGDLAEEEAIAVRAHLKVCPRCEEHYQQHAAEMGVSFTLVLGPSWPLVLTGRHLLLAMN